MFFTIRKYFPTFISNVLWGNRNKWGRTPKEKDACWQEWQNLQTEFYFANQRRGIGTIVNDSGYNILSSIDLSDKVVLEFGPGDMRHQKYWNSVPRKYLIADIHDGMMKSAINVFEINDISYDSFLVSRNERLPINDNSVDIIISFYSLEHLYPLLKYLEDMKQYLKPNGLLVGAIPAEGGIFWALGRLLTSHRWLKNNTNINPNKLICWEHPNFADHIISTLDAHFVRRFVKAWPMPWLPLLDNNLTFKFCYQNKM